MNIDFPLVLVMATLITGVIWAADAWFGAPRRRAAAERASDRETALKEPVVVEYAKAFFPVILIVLLLRSFLVEPFRIPSGSMMPTLLVGDFILVNKFSYGIRLPVLNTKVLELGEPQRGDVVVFRYPEDPAIDYIKRVVGLPGDRITYQNKTLSINGKSMYQDPVGTYMGTGAGVSSSGADLRLEDLDGVSHQILVRPNSGGIEGSVVVPPGHYFMMGDNRDNSKDSRYFGPVPEGNLVGKAFMIWMSWDSADGGVGWNRIGERIH
jgi:signal peptidase I